jgi:hypothetical protein
MAELRKKKKTTAISGYILYLGVLFIIVPDTLNVAAGMEADLSWLRLIGVFFFSFAILVKMIALENRTALALEEHERLFRAIYEVKMGKKWDENTPPSIEDIEALRNSPPKG